MLTPNLSTNYEAETRRLTIESTLIGTFLVALSIFGSLGNLLIIAAVRMNINLRTTCHYLIVNLALADFCGTFIAIPLRAVDELRREAFPLLPCRIIIAITVFTDGISRINILLIAIDRFIAVRWPFRYAEITKKKIAFIVFSAWLLTALFALLPAVGLVILRRETSQGICFFYSTLKGDYVLTYVAVFYFVPLLAVTPTHCFILKESHRHIRKIYNVHFDSQSTRHSDGLSDNGKIQTKQRIIIIKQRRVTKLVGVLIGVFIVFVAPISIIDFLKSVSTVDVPSVVTKLAVCLIYSNLAVNVLVYAGYHSEFRRTFHRIFKYICCSICSAW